MWRRCRPPCTQKLQFSLKAREISLFRGPVYAAYVPGTDIVVVGGESLNLPPKPRGSSDSCEKRWKTWSAISSTLCTVHLEWWQSAESTVSLPRPTKRLGAFMYGLRRAEIRYAPLEGEPLVEYSALPELVQRFWRSTIAKLFRFTEDLRLSTAEADQMAEYSRMWTPFCWSFFSFNEQQSYPTPPRDYFNTLLELARSCRGTLPITSQNLTQINCYTNQVFAQLSHRYGFLNLSTNYILAFALSDKIASAHWAGRCGDVELTVEDINRALCHWAEHNIANYTLALDASPLQPERNLQLHRIAQSLGVSQWTNPMCNSLVLNEEQDFLERAGSLDPNYIKVPNGTNFIIKSAFVPVLPLVPKNNRVCAFLYSVIQNDSFFAHFPSSAEPLACVVSHAGATYALSALINLSTERLRANLPINM